MGSLLFDTEKKENSYAFVRHLRLFYKISWRILRSGIGKVKFKLFIV
jgi:hypothetical protein